MNESPVINRGDGGGMHGMVFVVLAAAASFVPAFHLWPFLWLAAIAAYAVVVAAVPALRASFRPLRFGHASKPSVAATGILAVGSCLVLVAFQVLMHPDLRDRANLLPTTGLGGLLAAGMIFATLNALLEEVVFRGILFDAVESQWGAWVAVIATAGIFGFGHMRGYPPGPSGAVLAGIYGFCLGGLRAFTGGIGLPVIAHIAADATIFTLVACSGTV
jgi:membrane protease YdiL (CAAX protease family)